jgi:hypothetical protein
MLTIKFHDPLFNKYLFSLLVSEYIMNDSLENVLTNNFAMLKMSNTIATIV